MALIDELKERYDKLGLKVDQLTAECEVRLSAIKEIQRERGDLVKAYVALEPPPAVVTEPEPTKPEPQDDASEFAEEGYAPVIEAEPLADPIWNEPEPEPTDPQADALAKAADYYSPEAVAERNKFNPFAMFRKEGDQ